MLLHKFTPGRNICSMSSFYNCEIFRATQNLSQKKVKACQCVAVHFEFISLFLLIHSLKRNDAPLSGHGTVVDQHSILLKLPPMLDTSSHITKKLKNSPLSSCLPDGIFLFVQLPTRFNTGEPNIIKNHCAFVKFLIASYLIALNFGATLNLLLQGL